MKSVNDVKIGKKNERIVVTPAEMCKVLVGGTNYIVPYNVAKLISDLSEELDHEQHRKRKDDEEITSFLEKQCLHIAYALGGGDKDSVAYYGENLLNHSIDFKVPLPAGYEFDDGTREESFQSVVAKRIFEALHSARSARGELMKHLDGSVPSDICL